MSYAQAAGSGTQNGAEKIYNKNTVVCFANGVNYEALADGLNAKGYWKDVIGYQEVDFNGRYVIVFWNNETRDRLVENGIDIDGVNVTFAYHPKKEDPKIRVFVSQLPTEIKLHELHEVFDTYGSIHNISKIEKGGRYG